jgi:hypothetical protein
MFSAPAILNDNLSNNKYEKEERFFTSTVINIA